MSNCILPVNYEGSFCYNICIESTFDHLAANLDETGVKGHRICIVTDSNVAPLYLEQVTDILHQVCPVVTSVVLPAGEENKTLDQIRGIYKKLIDNHFDRKDYLLALGGGVVGDMTGFAAATFLRGIRFIQVPTTLLSQVDSSIGGKTGVDFDHYKNMVGAFHQPSLVYINISTLNTLGDDQFASGMGEVLKHGLIRDEAYYVYVLDHMDEIEQRDAAVMMKVVEGSCRIKKKVVENDPKEQGERAILNFGHTIGHAIEKEMDFKLLHGECVALGSAAAAFISKEKGLLSEEEYVEIRDMMVAFSLPISIEGLAPEDILNAAKHDKKMDSGKIRFILLDKIGHALIDYSVTDEEMLAGIRSLYHEF